MQFAFGKKARIGYNLVLAAVVVSYYVAALPASQSLLSIDLGLGIFVLAVVANVAFCAAYAIDIFAQMSSFNAAWLKARWIVLTVGILFAATITRFVATGMFSRAI